LSRFFVLALSLLFFCLIFKVLLDGASEKVCHFTLGWSRSYGCVGITVDQREDRELSLYSRRCLAWKLEIVSIRG